MTPGRPTVRRAAVAGSLTGMVRGGLTWYGYAEARTPRQADLPARVMWFSKRALTEGVALHRIEGVSVCVTSVARTVADCFKYRNKIGLDVALEAVRKYRRTRRSIDDLVRAARSVRVAHVMRPYLEALA